MDRQWINYQIFISSTFRDMDCERDMIRFNVIPQLNNHYHQRRVQFQAIDLRVGINTADIDENQRENYVLDICMNKIDQSRPFFVGLLGERYGWIPDTERWKIVVDKLSDQNRPLLKGSQGCSVTELEILYGAIGEDGKYLNHSIFMMRKPNSYELMPNDKKKNYIDEYSDDLDDNQKIEHKEKLKELKKTIAELTARKQMNKCVCPYTVTWDDKNDKFIDLEDFTSRLFAKLCDEIDKELDTIAPETFTWQVHDRINAEDMINLLVKQSERTSSVIQAIDLLHQGSTQILISGETGSGKSVVAAHCVDFLKKKGFICCIGWLGLTDHSHHMRPIIVRWIQQLTNDDYPESRLFDRTQVKDVELYEILHEAVKQNEVEGNKVFFMLDGIEQLRDYYEKELYQMWIYDDMRVILTAYNSVIPEIMRYHTSMVNVPLSALNNEDKKLIIAHEEAHGNIQLPKSIYEKLVTRQLTPLQLRLIMLLFSHLAIVDFQNIRSIQGMSDIDKINLYLEQLYDRAPQDLEQLIKYVIHELAVRMQLPNSYENIFTWLAASPQGLGQNEIVSLLRNDADVLQLHSLVYLLGDILVTDHYTLHWKIRNKVLRQALLPQDARPVFKQLVDLLLPLPDSAPLKQQILIYCLIEAEDYSSGREYLGSFSKYSSIDDEKLWYGVSTHLLLADPKRLEHLKALASQMQPKQLIIFVWHLIKYGLDDIDLKPEASAWCRLLLMDFTSVEQLDHVAAYYLGLMLLQYNDFIHPGAPITSDDKRSIRIALDALEHSYHLKPDYGDVRSFYRFALLKMVDIAMDDGHFDKVDEYIETAQNLS